MKNNKNGPALKTTMKAGNSHETSYLFKIRAVVVKRQTFQSKLSVKILKKYGIKRLDP